MIIVPDTSVIIDGRITKLVEEKEYKKSKVLVHEAVVAELESQANKGRESGYKGLEELNHLRRLSDAGTITLEYVGKRPRIAQFKDIDEIIRNTAREEGGVLLTSDRIQSKIAEVKSIGVLYLRKRRVKKKLGILDLFDDTTMSVHLRDRVPPMAKKGKPGEIKLVKLSKKASSEKELKNIAEEILGYARIDPDSFIEIEREGATVIQLGQLRIAIARPPFSDGYEITAVRPIAEIALEDYKLSDKLLARLRGRAEGVLVAGPPGAGKSTFSQALAEFYRSLGKIVKTMESPRDLLVSDEITQYAPLEGDMEKTADILLLVRPDYTIYDEVRKTKDFKIFADMRLAGVGMVGVVHANKGIDAVQRLIGRVELGMIPQIVDTVVFIKDGAIEKIYKVRFTVKVPGGMVEADLARPVIEVQDFETDETEYEIYTFGDETVVMPAQAMGGRGTSLEKLAGERVVQEIKRIAPKAWVDVSVEGGRAIVWVEEKFIPIIIGKGGKNIAKIERALGLSIDIQEFGERALPKRAS
ncbi:MAG: PINc/VapC family ATPase, partial [Candidatus Hydrothermarchaeota archaeon]|nr:PINc/VapC family ATPase [Candidatus Hydrothermarchaeota archaeon]